MTVRPWRDRLSADRRASLELLPPWTPWMSLQSRRQSGAFVRAERGIARLRVLRLTVRG